MEVHNTFERVDDKNGNDKIQYLQKKLELAESEISELKQNIEQKVIERTVEINKSLKDKARFIDSLSHDLATPITPLISLLPMIKDELSDEKTKELMDTCIRNVEYIKRVINNARELSDVSQTDLVLKKENLSDIINKLIVRYDLVFNSYNIKINNNIEKNTNIKTEKNRLIQVLDHVTSNAINSMPEGGTLTFNSKIVKKEDQNFIQISITDTGKGLTREQIDRLFDEFYKTDESRHKLDSTGLGLAICKKIINKHGGKIWADSHGIDKGTTIYFTIPSEESIYTRSF